MGSPVWNWLAFGCAPAKLCVTCVCGIELKFRSSWIYIYIHTSNKTKKNGGFSQFRCGCSAIFDHQESGGIVTFWWNEFGIAVQQFIGGVTSWPRTGFCNRHSLHVSRASLAATNHAGQFINQSIHPLINNQLIIIQLNNNNEKIINL